MAMRNTDIVTRVIEEQIKDAALCSIFDKLLNDQIEEFKSMISPVIQSVVEQITYKQIECVHNMMSLADNFNVHVKINNEELNKITSSEE
ncbi:MAG TPA: hypothetical protein EYN67_18460 [Flavobacteriales bacterium]|nr:hypothetical protein [Flavobacteriales bacterium]